MKTRSGKNAFLLMAVAAALTGCGGDAPPSSEAPGMTTAPQRVAADAGLDQNVAVGTVVALVGSASTETEGPGLIYTWSFVYRPPGSTATLSGVHAPSPSFLADAEGLYMLKLVVSNGAKNSSPAIVTIHAQ